MTKRVFVVRDIAIDANKKIRIPIEGDWFTVLSASGEFWMGFDNMDPQPGIEAGLGFPAGKRGYEHVVLENHNATELTARVVFSEDAIRDNRLVLTLGSGINIIKSADFADAADVALIADTATAIVAANTGRRSVVISNDTGAEIRVGGATVAVDRGLKVAAGGVVTVETAGDVYGYSVAGGLVSLSEVLD